MSARRPLRSLVFLMVLFPVGCEGPNDVSGPPPTPPCVPTNVAGVWDVNWGGNGIPPGTCYMNTWRVWTIQQNGCDFTIESQSYDPANGATGHADAGEFSVYWKTEDSCYKTTEEIRATVDGDTMTGTYDISQYRKVFQGCSPGGYCTAFFKGVRRTQANRAP